MALTTKDRVEKYLLTTIDPSFDDQIDEWIEGVEEMIEMMIDRKLFADATPVEYKYSGNGKSYMMVDDFLQITKVEDDETDITTEVVFEPANRLPIFKIVNTVSTFAKGVQNITVTGRQGYMEANAPKKDLMHAATVIVAGIINASKNSSNEIASESIGRYTVSYVTNAQRKDYQNALATIKVHRRIR